MFPQQAMQYPIYARDNAFHCPRQRQHGNRLRIPIWRKCLLQFLLRYIPMAMPFTPTMPTMPAPAYAKAAGDIDDIKLRHRRRGQRTDDHDEGKASGTSGRHAEEGSESPDKIWAANSPQICMQRLQRWTLRDRTTTRRFSPRSQHHSMWKKFIIFFVRCSATLANIRSAIHGTGEETPRTSEYSQRLAALGQERPGKLQAGQVGLWGCFSTSPRTRKQRIRTIQVLHRLRPQNHRNDGGIGTVSAVSLSSNREAEVLVAEEGPCSQTTKNYTKNRRSRNVRWPFWATFWQGWLSVTSKYANLKPLPSFDPQISGEITVLKWSHSIIEEHNYFSQRIGRRLRRPALCRWTLRPTMVSSMTMRRPASSTPLQQVPYHRTKSLGLCS